MTAPSRGRFLFWSAAVYCGRSAVLSAGSTGRPPGAVSVLLSHARPAQCKVNLGSGLKCRDGIGARSQIAHTRDFLLQRQFQRFAECGVIGLASHLAHNAVEVLCTAEPKLPAFTGPHVRRLSSSARAAPGRQLTVIDAWCTPSVIARERGNSVWTQQKRCQMRMPPHRRCADSHIFRAPVRRVGETPTLLSDPGRYPALVGGRIVAAASAEGGSGCDR
jgi:hypothetical protein